MNTWYIKELATITGVSVRTLHHYDHIDLLKPSIRQGNNYRVYSENDLLKLQQIIAMKYFGFSLTQIKTILANDNDLFEQFALQAKLLQEKVESLKSACQTLNSVIDDCSKTKQIPWQKIIEMIEVFTMTQQLENAWVADVLNKEQLKEYAKFEQNLKKQSSPAVKEIFEKNWFHLLSLVNENINEDPCGEVGIRLGKQLIDLVNTMYGKEHRHLSNVIWEKGFRQNKMDKDHGITHEMVEWLDKAIGAYYHQRVTEVLSQVNKTEDKKLKAQWQSLLEDMHGFDEKSNQEFVQSLLDNSEITHAAKQWLMNA